jgi:hypothetical protein
MGFHEELRTIDTLHARLCREWAEAECPVKIGDRYEWRINGRRYVATRTRAKREVGGDGYVWEATYEAERLEGDIHYRTIQSTLSMKTGKVKYGSETTEYFGWDKRDRKALVTAPPEAT